MSETEARFRTRSPFTGPIVGGLLAGLIAIFAIVIIFRLVRRRWWKQSSPKHDPERPLGLANAKDKRPSTEMETESGLAHTIVDHNHTDDSKRDPDHPDLPPLSKQDVPRRLGSPPTAAISFTLSPQTAKPTASATSDPETQSISATTFVTAMQSPRCSANAP